MTPEQITLIKSSWAKVLPIQDQAAKLFYDKLFELDPTLKPLFRGDAAQQGQKLMTMLNNVVEGLERLGELLPAVRDLGRRHVVYGVQPEHYGTVGAALLWTLGASLGAAFTPAAERAWGKAFTALADVMKAAA